MHRILFVIIMVFFTCNLACAAGLKDETEIRQVTDDIMKLVAANDLKSAAEIMKKHTAPMPPAEIDSFYLQTKTERDKMENRVGKTVGYEYISTKKIGSSLIRIQYLEKLKETGMAWSFYFYKTADGWMMEGWNWNAMRVLFTTN